MTENPYLTPTYTNLLMKAILDVVIARNANNINGYWTSLTTLYIIAPTEVLTEISNKINEILNKLAKIKIEGFNYDAQREALQTASYTFKTQNADIVFSTIMASLHKHKYTESIYGAKPRFEGTGRL